MSPFSEPSNIIFPFCKCLVKTFQEKKRKPYWISYECYDRLSDCQYVMSFHFRHICASIPQWLCDPYSLVSVFIANLFWQLFPYSECIEFNTTLLLFRKCYFVKTK